MYTCAFSYIVYATTHKRNCAHKPIFICMYFLTEKKSDIVEKMKFLYCNQIGELEESRYYMSVCYIRRILNMLLNCCINFDHLFSLWKLSYFALDLHSDLFLGQITQTRGYPLSLQFSKFENVLLFVSGVVFVVVMLLFFFSLILRAMNELWIDFFKKNEILSNNVFSTRFSLFISLNMDRDNSLRARNSNKSTHLGLFSILSSFHSL